MYLDNWQFDLYQRIDSEPYIPYRLEKKYREEIAWCYRLGYMDAYEREQLDDYLTRMVAVHDAEFKHLHDVRMAQIRYEQQELLEQEKERAYVRELFKNGIRYERGKYIIISQNP